MQKIGSRTYQCANNETITIRTQATDTAHGVTFDLYGRQGRIEENQPFPFQIDNSKEEPTVLTLVFTFSGTSDGQYDIDLSGSPGSDQDVVKQRLRPTGSVFYRFFTR